MSVLLTGTSASRKKCQWRRRGTCHLAAVAPLLLNLFFLDSFNSILLVVVVHHSFRPKARHHLGPGYCAAPATEFHPRRPPFQNSSTSSRPRVVSFRDTLSRFVKPCFFPSSGCHGDQLGPLLLLSGSIYSIQFGQSAAQNCLQLSCPFSVLFHRPIADVQIENKWLFNAIEKRKPVSKKSN